MEEYIVYIFRGEFLFVFLFFIYLFFIIIIFFLNEKLFNFYFAHWCRKMYLKNLLLWYWILDLDLVWFLPAKLTHWRVCKALDADFKRYGMFSIFVFIYK